MSEILQFKRALVAWSVAAGAFLGLALVAVPAQAQSLDTITCTGSQTTTFNPAITNQPTTVTLNTSATYGPCISTVPGITSGSRNLTTTVSRSCLTLLEGGPLSTTINWNNGQSSTAQIVSVSNLTGAAYTVIQTGTVTSGAFQGRSFVHQLTAPSTDILLCTLGLGSAFRQSTSPTSWRSCDHPAQVPVHGSFALIRRSHG